jgi:hypothetical protein
VGVIFLDVREGLQLSRCCQYLMARPAYVSQFSQWPHNHAYRGLHQQGDAAPTQWTALQDMLHRPGLCALVVISGLPFVFQPRDDEHNDDLQVSAPSRRAEWHGLSPSRRAEWHGMMTLTYSVYMGSCGVALRVCAEGASCRALAEPGDRSRGVIG